MEKAKRGRPKKENNYNEVCRICQVNLKLTYGNFGTKSCVNLFKPSTRKETFRVVWCESLNNLGISFVDSPSDSQLACNGCYRKIKNLCELFQFIGKVSCKSHIGPRNFFQGDFRRCEEKVLCCVVSSTQ